MSTGQASEEKVFFERAGHKVTNSRFVVPGQTYAMHGVTSVGQHAKEPSKTGPNFVMIVGALVTLISFTAFEESVVGALVGLLVGLSLNGAGILWLRALKATHIVDLHSASGEARALASKDGQFVGGVVQALKDAIVSRR